MILLFDFHAESERLALWRRDPDGRDQLGLRSLQGETLAEIGPEYLPLSPQWSPDGSKVAFGSNDGLLYTHQPGDARPTVVFASPSLQAGFCEWAGDGKRLVFSAYDKVAQTPPNIYCLELDSGQGLPLTNDPKTVDRFPHWSPSGQWVAFQRQFLDDPELRRQVYLVEVGSGHCLPVLTASKGDTVSGRFGWSPDSSTLLVTLTHQGRSELRAVRIQDQTTAWSYKSEGLQSGAFSPQGDRILCLCKDELLWFSYPQGTLLARLALEASAAVRHYFNSAQIGFDRQATSVLFLGEDFRLYRWKTGADYECILADQPPVRPVFTHEEYTVTSRDGRLIPVQRFIPAQPRPAAILYVHGGPGGVIDPDDPLMLRLLAEGVEFVCAAYRGSCGYGTEHEEANRGEYGRADVWDILAAGCDWKERFGENRPLVVAGYSYGGYLTLLGLAQDEIPFSGGISLYGLSDLAHMSLHRHRAFPVDPDQHAAAQVERSPLQQAGRIRVPLLIFHGELDTVATTREMEAIQASVIGEGGVCELIIFADDTHGLQRHRDEIHERILEFLKRFE
jgi:dipeptidyl aminopeptidase/acylaminoacyl peptidase